MSCIQTFAEERLKNKKLTDIPGCCNADYFLLTGYTNAHQLIGQFLVYNMDKELFNAWLEEYITNEQNRRLIVESCAAWCQKHI